MRKFETGATRDDNTHKLNFAGYLSPIAVQRFAEYMQKHQTQADGQPRDAGNWKHGIPKDAYLESAFRHFHDWWMEHEGHASREGIEDALCGLWFNVQGYLHELLKQRSDSVPAK